MVKIRPIISLSYGDWIISKMNPPSPTPDSLQDKLKNHCAKLWIIWNSIKHENNVLLGKWLENILKFYKDPVFKQIHLEYTLAYNTGFCCGGKPFVCQV